MANSNEEIHAGDYGTIFRVTIIDPNTDAAQDISDSNNKRFLFKKPDTTTVNVSGTFYTDGSDGIIQYTVQDGDGVIESGTEGKWALQVRIESAAGSWTSSRIFFNVYANLDS